jgi:threonine/homoserine/homoserine lactone efflux protein
MQTPQIVGLVLIGLGFAEPLMGRLLAARISDASRQRVLRWTMTFSGIVLIGVGLAVFKGWIAM